VSSVALHRALLGKDTLEPSEEVVAVVNAVLDEVNGV
jgi:hypothetical protein